MKLIPWLLEPISKQDRKAIVTKLADLRAEGEMGWAISEVLERLLALEEVIEKCS